MAKDRRYKALINSMRWRRLRRDKLTRNPLCEHCYSDRRIRAATEVHHIVPVESGLSMAEMARLAYDPHNLVSLCHDCHVEAHKAMGRSGKAAARRITDERLTRFRRRFLEDAPPGGVF